MAYSYGTQGAPAVGGGAPGLPSRSAIGSLVTGVSAPSSDYLLCDGSEVPAASYPQLAEKLGGYSNGTPANVYSLAASYTGGDSDGVSKVIRTRATTALSVSSDGGASFSVVTVANAMADIYYIGNNVWVDAQGSYRSTDNGTTWTTSASSVGAGVSRALASDGNGKAMVVSGGGTTSTPMYTFVTSDYGNNWTQTYTINVSIFPTGCAHCNGRWFYSVPAGVRYSDDFGSSWSGNIATTPTLSSGEIVARLFGDNRFVALVTNLGRISVSKDKGETWSPLKSVPSRGPSWTDMNTNGSIAYKIGWMIRKNAAGDWAIGDGQTISVYRNADFDSCTTYSINSATGIMDGVFLSGSRVGGFDGNTAFQTYSALLERNTIRLPNLMAAQDGYNVYIKAR